MVRVYSYKLSEIGFSWSGIPAALITQIVIHKPEDDALDIVYRDLTTAAMLQYICIFQARVEISEVQMVHLLQQLPNLRGTIPRTREDKHP